MQRILIISADDAVHEGLAAQWPTEGVQLMSARNAQAAIALLESTFVDAILCCAEMPGIDDFDILPQLDRRQPGTPIVLISDHARDGLAERALRRGAYDALPLPLEGADIRLLLRRIEEHERLRHAHEILVAEVERTLSNRPIVAASDAMIELLESMERGAVFESHVLITGERGTGKEVLARAIHAQSHRRSHGFVPVDMCVLAPESLEAVLFGQVPGELGGRRPAKRGLFIEAGRGTIFIDEAARLPIPLQGALLRAIRDEEIQPLGDSKAMPIDARIIASSQYDLRAEAAAGRFDPELLARLETVHIHAPALRERKDDIPLLFDYFLARGRDAGGSRVRSVSDEALECLTRYSWPGNIRELEIVIERAVLLASGDRITVQDLPYDLVASREEVEGAQAGSLSLRRARRAFEAHIIQRALRISDGNRTHAARLLGVSHRALLYKMKAYSLRD